MDVKPDTAVWKRGLLCCFVTANQARVFQENLGQNQSDLSACTLCEKSTSGSFTLQEIIPPSQEAPAHTRGDDGVVRRAGNSDPGDGGGGRGEAGQVRARLLPQLQAQLPGQGGARLLQVPAPSNRVSLPSYVKSTYKIVKLNYVMLT